MPRVCDTIEWQLMWWLNDHIYIYCKWYTYLTQNTNTTFLYLIIYQFSLTTGIVFYDVSNSIQLSCVIILNSIYVSLLSRFHSFSIIYINRYKQFWQWQYGTNIIINRNVNREIVYRNPNKIVRIITSAWISLVLFISFYHFGIAYNDGLCGNLRILHLKSYDKTKALHVLLPMVWHWPDVPID